MSYINITLYILSELVVICQYICGQINIRLNINKQTNVDNIECFDNNEDYTNIK